ncbi:DUF4430 domain-containing protein [Paenibacillus sp. JDR-2]|uniref:DUF4430 domain-containing protein n=1 Tax=Paenibacillus sp. (strain JDR-2) TaxID=324057 RepID=UPI0001AAF769|nr:DUF4430 domain-containing protein [Paenibacillus sp. JDR-2]ACT01338.1 hypothetical protein Pjdr2_2685 [Paenibacillus sp. JDR-2]
MNKKKWLSAMLIIGVLAIAYFWGGNYAKNPTSESAVATTPPPAEELASTPPSNAANQTQSEPGEDPLKQTEADKSSSSGLPSEEPAATGQEQSPSTEKPPATNSDSSHATETVKPAGEPKASPTPSESAKPSGSGSGKGAEATPATKPPAASPEETKDKYQTDPVPSGKPQPVEWQDAKIDKKKPLSVTLSVSAATILNNLDSFNEDKLEVLPKDGVIYPKQKVTFYEGESVFDVLLREMKKNKIHMEFEMTPIYNSNYVEGIHNIYEFDCGELSGWMYKVNGWFPNYGASRYALKDGDVVEWVYTCDLGRDVGGYSAGAGVKS